MVDFRRVSTLTTIIAIIAMLWFVTFSLTAEGQVAPPPETGAGPTNRPSVNLRRPGDPGQPLDIDGWVHSTNGKPIVGAIVTVWHADATGTYREDRYRGSLRTGKDGKYHFSTVLPGQTYSVKHIHIVVTHAEYEPVETQILFKGDPHLDEATAREFAIPLEEGTIKGKTLLFGRFDIVMRPAGSS